MLHVIVAVSLAINEMIAMERAAVSCSLCPSGRLLRACCCSAAIALGSGVEWRRAAILFYHRIAFNVSLRHRDKQPRTATEVLLLLQSALPSESNGLECSQLGCDGGSSSSSSN